MNWQQSSNVHYLMSCFFIHMLSISLKQHRCIRIYRSITCIFLASLWCTARRSKQKSTKALFTNEAIFRNDPYLSGPAGFVNPPPIPLERDVIWEQPQAWTEVGRGNFQRARHFRPTKKISSNEKHNPLL